MENKKIKKESSIAIKSYAVFCSLVLILATISFSINLAPTVKAQQTGCCEKTNDIPPAYCIDNLESTNCSQGFHTDRVCSEFENCKKGVLITDDGCVEDKTKAEYLDTPGSDWEPADSIEDVEKCQLGCCSIPIRVRCYTTTKVECDAQSGDLPHSFTGGIEDSECRNMCNGKERGTCVKALDGGKVDCVYTVRDGCKNILQKDVLSIGDFFPNTFARDVVGCVVRTHDSKKCGLELFGDQDKICWFDNKGNQEECEMDCRREGPTYDCETCNPKNETNCYDKMRGIEVNKSDPYCKYTSCEKTVAGAQKMLDNGKIRLWTENEKKVVLLNARSICYNFYTHYGDDRMNGIATGLQNQQLECQKGDLVVQGLGVDRKLIGIQAGGELGLYHCNPINNTYEKCIECGSGSKWTDFLGDIFGIAWPQWGLNELISNRCYDCEDEERGLCVFNADAYGGSARRVGSCNPKYPPGTDELCGECGKGGDAIYNLCTRKECYSLGNCKFTRANDWNRFASAFWFYSLSYYSHRVNWVPLECGAELALGGLCLIPGLQFLGVPCGGCDKCLTCFPDRWRRHVLAFPTTAFGQLISGLGTLYDIVKGTEEAITVSGKLSLLEEYLKPFRG